MRSQWEKSDNYACHVSHIGIDALSLGDLIGADPYFQFT